MYLSTTLDEAHPTPTLPISPVTSLRCSTAHHTIHYKHNSTPSWNLRDIRAAFQHEKQASHDATDRDVSPMTCLNAATQDNRIVRCPDAGSHSASYLDGHDRLVDSILWLGANSLLAFPALVASVAAEFTQASSTAMAIASRPSR
ncbi:uncharacterized protein CCOS01_15364 [Colletotrichum costaricense]|uniref:Uncharacterized protein n=1 Tax=Colletotrichum costaricense TaxID=1209916 RepID=A0AAJ0DTJ9_9PEZI|nr:uncharacterized protein CCOS01_15364 [Colletotrichum costaricense]KAK1510533.1 hypothetical protein CCOS01_15364 [Colletotrichum costaricense]